MCFVWPLWVSSMYYDIFFHIWPSSFERLLVAGRRRSCREWEEFQKFWWKNDKNIFRISCFVCPSRPWYKSIMTAKYDSRGQWLWLSWRSGRFQRQRGLQFKSSHCQSLYWTFGNSNVLKKERRQKEAWHGNFFKSMTLELYVTLFQQMFILLP